MVDILNPNEPTGITFHKLPAVPGLLGLYGKAALEQVPVIGGSRDASSVPSIGYEVSGITVSAADLGAYTRNTGLRLSGDVPLTYPFLLSFPVAMQLMTGPGFPFAAMGSVHLRNEITTHHALHVGDEMFLRVWAENLREHPSGLLIDMVSEVYTELEPEPAWRQVSTFLSRRRTSLTPPKDAARSEREHARPAPPTANEIGDPTTTIRVDQGIIGRYAEISGDRNPIHVSSVGAKAFGFPGTIAHGMWTAAALLRAVEGRIPVAVRYTVQFGKPVILPARVGVYVRPGIGDDVISGIPAASESTGAFTITARKPGKLGHVFATATVEVQ